MKPQKSEILPVASNEDNIKVSEKAKLQLQNTQKLVAIGTMAGKIAHDFNTMLAAILGYTELAITELPPDCDARESLNEVLRAVDLSQDLVKQILTFANNSEDGREPLKIHLIVRDALKLIKVTLPPEIEINENIDENCRPVVANPTQVCQVLMNLCTNAVHAMRDKGGVLEVSLEMTKVDQQITSVRSDLPPGRYALLTVSDTGSGMDQETAQRVFEPFYSTKKQGEGTGLGLAVVHDIVASHGGEVILRSELGKGTTFQVYLPIANDDTEQTVLVDRPINHKAGRILFVDHDPVITQLGKLILVRHGYDVTAICNSVDALAAFRLDPERYDLIIIEQTMPGIGCKKLAAGINRIRSEVPMVLMTDFIETDMEQQCRNVGFCKFLIKPLRTHELVNAIRNALDDASKTST